MMTLGTYQDDIGSHRRASIVAANKSEIIEMRAMIESHWRHNVGTATKEQLAIWQKWIDQLTELIK